MLLQFTIFKKHAFAGLADGGPGTLPGEGLDRRPERLGGFLEGSKRFQLGDPGQIVFALPLQISVLHFSAALGTFHRITSTGNMLSQQ